MAHQARTHSMTRPTLAVPTEALRRAAGSSCRAVIALCALLSVSGCGSEAPQANGSDGRASSAAATRTSEESVGSIELSLQAGDARLDAMNYAIVGGSGFVSSGSLDVSNSTRVSGVIGGIPFGKNYALTVNGKAQGQAPLDCAGSASFDLNAVGPTPVPILINCRGAQVAVTPAAMPAPVPPVAIFAFGCLLAVLGAALQRRSAQG